MDQKKDIYPPTNCNLELIENILMFNSGQKLF